ncbi:hypothetical protein [Agromyces larvae]|uniref:Secreted protein n=1 Tax=Agromyces larvae TaxID=2929802 RepID=A0ABY4BXK4_9MICO|nr:hypothetical protein [Agromyces larvae]UOE43864.1 hypothetical protein MTO99_17115 [Agromyces larvae]
MRKRGVFGAAILAVAMAFVAAPMAMAAPAQDVPEDAAGVISPENSLMASPEDLERLGFSADEVEKQRRGFLKLDEAERKRQDRLRAEQEAIVPHPEWLPKYEILPPSDDGVQPLTVWIQSCLDGPNDYKVGYLGADASGPQSYNCYHGSGSYDRSTYPTQHVYTLRAGNETGRVLYKYDTSAYYYYSVWRGPSDFNTYYFQEVYGTPNVYEVQLK